MEPMPTAGEVAFVRIRMGEYADQDVWTYYAVRPAELPAMLAELPDDEMRVEVVPASAFPGLRPPEWAPFPRSVHTIGTSVGEEWETWYAPITPPPVPGRG